MMLMETTIARGSVVVGSVGSVQCCSSPEDGRRAIFPVSVGGELAVKEVA